jgi:hypothetical protein
VVPQTAVIQTPTTVVSQPIVKKVTTTTITRPEIATTTVTRTNNLSDVLVSVIDNRKMELQRQIALLDPMQALPLTTTLTQISNSEQAALADNLMTYDEVLSLAGDLDALNNRVFAVSQANRLNPLVIFGNDGGREIAVTDMQLF